MNYSSAKAASQLSIHGQGSVKKKPLSQSDINELDDYHSHLRASASKQAIKYRVSDAGDDEETLSSSTTDKPTSQIEVDDSFTEYETLQNILFKARNNPHSNSTWSISTKSSTRPSLFKLAKGKGPKSKVSLFASASLSKATDLLRHPKITKGFTTISNLIKRRDSGASASSTSSLATVRPLTPPFPPEGYSSHLFGENDEEMKSRFRPLDSVYPRPQKFIEYYERNKDTMSVQQSIQHLRHVSHTLTLINSEISYAASVIQEYEGKVEKMREKYSDKLWEEYNAMGDQFNNKRYFEDFYSPYQEQFSASVLDGITGRVWTLEKKYARHIQEGKKRVKHCIQDLNALEHHLYLKSPGDKVKVASEKQWLESKSFVSM